MRRGYFSQLSKRHPFGRWFSLLLALLQIVAPMWHVCEMGGPCGDCKPQIFVSETKLTPAQKLSQIQFAPHCARCKPAKTATQKFNGERERFWAADARFKRFKGTCLARELTSMGRVTVAPIVLNFQITRVRVPRPQSAPRRTFFAFNLPLSRGPPAPFVV